MNAMPSTLQGPTRRDFLRTSLGVASVLSFPQVLLGADPGGKLNIAVVGAAGKGASDTDLCAGENIVALCDVDTNHAAGQRKKYPNAKFYRDFRKMLEEMGSGIDAVVVSTPDHLHAPVAAMAMRLGKHVYCQKPLSHSVYEARLLRDLARDRKVVTQMGNQGSAEDGLRRAVEVIQAGVIGEVREAHVWSNRPIWPQGLDRPPGEDSVPENLDWDLWLGPAPFRPYKAGAYHPFKWRGWFDFGTGALGDMACHTANMPFRALNLGYPAEVQAESSGGRPESFPQSSIIRLEFPARGAMPPVTFRWYDGGRKPNPDITTEIATMRGEVPGSGCLLAGSKGKLFSPDDYGTQFYVKLNDEREFRNGRDHSAVRAIPAAFSRNTHAGDSDKKQHLEWIAAIKGGPAPYSNFDIAGYLTEIILLGCVALRVGKRLEWDGPNMTAKNVPEAAQLVRREYRSGWTL